MLAKAVSLSKHMTFTSAPSSPSIVHAGSNAADTRGETRLYSSAQADVGGVDTNNKTQPKKTECNGPSQCQNIQNVVNSAFKTQGFAFPRLPGAFTVDKDAKDRKFACKRILVQPVGHEKPNDYWSLSLPDAESANDSTHRERLSVVWAVRIPA